MKIFAVSDIHGFYNEFIDALTRAEFNKYDPEHLLVVCGDCFDRGPDNYKVMQYLKSVPNKVLVRGNHESLLLECIDRRESYSHDVHNGTHATIMEFGRHYLPYEPMFYEACAACERSVKHFVDQMVDYYETENYVFVHSWIPVICKDNLPRYYVCNRKYEKMDDWREASSEQWEDARWGNPFSMASKKLFPDNKTIVFGHWHTSGMWALLEGREEFGDDAKFDAFYGNNYIALDGCTARSGQVNVVVIEDNLLS